MLLFRDNPKGLIDGEEKDCAFISFELIPNNNANEPKIYRSFLNDIIFFKILTSSLILKIKF